MGMRDYAVDDYGLLLKADTIKLIASKALEDFDEMNEDDYEYELYDMGVFDHISNFCGETICINDDGADEYWKAGESYSEDPVCYVAVRSFPTLFKAPYSNMEELIEEFKSKVGDYLPEDFDYRANIRHIVGTYWG